MAKRDPYFDNLKFILIVAVVVGHLVEPLIGPSRSLRTLYFFFYFFHMPLFVFISGYFSKNIESKDYAIKVISKFVVPYFIFECIYSVADYIIFKRESLVFSFATPYWVMWFLFSLILWKVALPYVVKIKYALVISFVVAVLIGYANDFGYYASLSRAIVFFPFFLAGYYFKADYLKHLFKMPIRILSAVILLSVFVTIYFKGQGIPPQWLYGSVPYEGLKHPEWYAGIYRAAIFLVAIVMSAATLALIPRVRIPVISDMGTRTMYAFLLHGLIIRYLTTTSFYAQIQGPWDKIYLILIGCAMAMMLSLSIFKNGLKYIVEPNIKSLFK